MICSLASSIGMACTEHLVVCCIRLVEGYDVILYVWRLNGAVVEGEPAGNEVVCSMTEGHQDGPRCQHGVVSNTTELKCN